MKKILVLLVLTFGANAQNTGTTTIPQRYFGIGYRLGAFQTSELNSNFYPVNRLFLNVDPIKYLRADFQWGISNSSQERSITGGTGIPQVLTMSVKNSVMMIGLMGTYQFDDLLMYCGLRFGNNKSSSDNLDYSSTGYYIVTDELKGTSLAPVLGGEYRFGNRFAVGAEINYMMINQTMDPGSVGAPNMKSKQNLLETSAFFRFFLF
ncbi:MAG TPA: hypothetical protein PLQ93_13140 [Bacteroidia bacterium]|nr:hypothetical protein [Bacteroidia bacterium]